MPAAGGGWRLALWGGLTTPLALVAPMLLRKRLARGKEDPARWREKLGEPSLPRPEGRLIWLHAVGLGEVLALRGLIGAMAAAAPDLQFLITSSARSSALALAGQMPPRTQHQFLPLDVPRYIDRFLAHWRPALSIWAEQDLWPGAVARTARAGVPLAMVNARMNATSYHKRAKARGIYAESLAKFALIAAQDAETATHLGALGAASVRVTGSLKAAAPPLRADSVALEQARAMLAGQKPWLLASSHPEDEAVALRAQVQILAQDPARGLIIAPRDPHRGAETAEAARALGLTAHRRSLGQGPQGQASQVPASQGQVPHVQVPLAQEPEAAAVWIVDTFGEMGLWYRLADVALIGGTFGPTEGHNPWEPAALGAAILHGAHCANFAADYAQLAAARAALGVTEAGLVAAVLGDHSAMAARALALSTAAQGSLAPLAHDLLELIA